MLLLQVVAHQLQQVQEICTRVGIIVRGNIHGSPGVNTALLALGLAHGAAGEPAAAAEPQPKPATDGPRPTPVQTKRA